MNIYLIDMSFTHQSPELSIQRMVQLDEELDYDAVQSKSHSAVQAIVDRLKAHASEFSTCKLIENNGKCWVDLRRGQDSLLEVNFITDVADEHLDTLTRIAALKIH